MYFPVLLKLGPIHLYTYGFMVALAFVAAGLFILWQTKLKKLPFQKFLNFSPYFVIAIMVGARVYYVFQHLSYYQLHIGEAFAFWNGGLSMYGGVIAGVLLIFLFLRKESPLQRWLWLDILGMAILLGSAIGRIGCFLNGCCFGSVSKVPWGIVDGFLNDGLKRHPTQLYESIFYLIAFIILLLINQKLIRKITVGTIFLGGIFLHSLVRFMVEFFRYSDSFIGPFKTAQVVTLIIMILAIITFIFTYQARLKLRKEQ